MPDCPTFPPVPAEVMARFGKMREWDVKVRAYANDLCAVIPDAVDLGPVEQRVADLEALVINLSQRILALENAPAESNALTWIAVSTTPFVVTGHNIGLRVNTAVGAINLLLPKASQYNGESIYIKDDAGQAGTNNILVNAYGTDTIDDDAFMILAANYVGIEIKSNGTGWEIV